MRAVEAKSFGGPDVLVASEVPDPVPGPDEVLIEVAAADVMFLDTRLRSGWGVQFFAVEPPYIPGGAVAGVVSAVGADADPAWVGRRVATRTAASGIGGGLPIGGYAERAVAKAATLGAVPDGFDLVSAVATVHDGRTALAAAQAAGIRAGESVLITAAGGGLGTLLIQLARAAGATVIAAAHGEKKLRLAQRLGAQHLVDYEEPGWADQVLAAAGGDGVSVVLDGAGGQIGRDALGTIKSGGRILGYGNAAGGAPGVDTESAAAQGVTVIGLSDLTQSAAIDWQALGTRALADAAAGRLEIVVGQTFPLDAASAAHAAIESRAATGRTVLTVGDLSAG